MCTYTLRSLNGGMCEDLLTEAGYDAKEQAEVIEEMIRAADEAAVDAAYEVMREHGLKTLADRERGAQSATALLSNRNTED